MSTGHTVSVVVINYNNGRFIRTCLDALVGVPQISEIIVVDDGSTDDSLKILKRYDIKLVAHKENLGPVKARNSGAKLATGEHILFLDMDAKLDPDYIPVVAAFLGAHSDAGVVSGKVIAESGERMWFNFGYDPAPFRDAMQGLFGTLALRYFSIRWLRAIIEFLARPFTLNFTVDRVRKVDWVVEIALVTRRKTFEILGGFDENLFMFFEGPDYCRRARGVGYHVYYLPTAICRHLGGHSHAAIRDKIFVESRKYYLRKYS